MKLTTVQREMLPFAWPDIEPWIIGACDRVPSELTVQGLRDMCLQEEAALVLIGEPGKAPVAAGVTQVRDHEDGRRVCWILALGGTASRSWLDTLKTIETNARRIGCASVQFVGRPGWAGLLPDYACHARFEKVL
jgi:hypothetical protein